MTLLPIGPQYGVKYTLIGPDGTTVTFNDTDDPNNIGTLTEITGIDSPEVRENADDLVEMDGGLHGDFFYGRRPITLSGLVHGHHSAAERNMRTTRLMQATNAMRSDATLIWQADGGAPTQFVTLRRQQPLRITGGWNKDFQIAMVAADPRMYSVELHSQTISAGPTVVAINEVTRPSVEGGTTGWANYGSSNSGDGAISASQVSGGSVGAFSYDLSRTLGSPNGTQAAYVGTQADIGLDNQYVSVSVDGQSLALPGVGNFALRVRSFDSGGSYIGSTTVLTTPIIDTDWHRYKALNIPVSVLPVGAEKVGVELIQTSAAAGNIHMRADAAMVVVHGQPLAPTVDYFDGDQPGASWEGTAHASRSILGSGSDGMRFDMGFDMDFGIAALAGQTTLENQGNALSLPVLTVAGPGANPTLVNATTGQQIALIYTLNAGETLVVDTLNRTVMLNGIDNRYRAVDFNATEWWGLQPGTNDVRLQFFNYSSPASLRVDWRDAWL